MPYININTNVSVSKEQEETVKERLGKAIGLLPGKSESWLMVGFESEKSMYFRGNASQKIALVEVSVYGGINRSAADSLTEAITGILEQDIGVAQTYVKYEEVEIWGYNGSNF
jgi:Macrophage migration inhibitory factor (MIF).